MSENTSTSLVLTSVAAQLKATGFHQTGIARAVTELVLAYLGSDAHMSPHLIKALGQPKSAVGVVLGPKETSNDP